MSRPRDEQVIQTLAQGVSSCRRFDIGLSLLVLFREGFLQKGGSELIAELENLRDKLQVPMVVNEDIHGGWSRALAQSSDSHTVGWALISPSGDRAWAHKGPLEPAALSANLDAHLKRSPDVRSVDIRTGIELGAVMSPRDLFGSYADAIDELNEPRCPPSPLGRSGRSSRSGISETLVTFVHAASAASVAHLRRLTAQPQGCDADDERPAPVVVAVFDGASESEVQALQANWGMEFVAVADPEGRVSDRIGVCVWPTTLTLDGDGVVRHVQLGTHSKPTQPRNHDLIQGEPSNY